MTYEEKREHIKNQLVKARRSGDEEACKRLSPKWEQAKRRCRSCSVCGVRVRPGNKSGLCVTHYAPTITGRRNRARLKRLKNPGNAAHSRKRVLYNLLTLYIWGLS